MPVKDLQAVVQRSRYPLDAFLFVQRGLDHTVRDAHGELDVDQDHACEGRHVSGEQLCFGLRDFAVKEYGLLARTVLRRWHINTSEDFGRIVFAMVDAGLMHKTEDDTLADFVDIFDFADAFNPELTLTENA
ncbi:MAG: Minf_1886 family protein [Phycisphaeraceae bacterium]